MHLSDPQRRALTLLGDAPHHRTVANMRAHGITNTLLDRLVQEGLASMEPGATLSGNTWAQRAVAANHVRFGMPCCRAGKS
jgi:hypothetical protein